MVGEFFTAAAPFIMIGLVIAVYFTWFDKSEQNKENDKRSSNSGHKQ
jgi:hypothetical protein